MLFNFANLEDMKDETWKLIFKSNYEKKLQPGASSFVSICHQRRWHLDSINRPSYLP
jgi:hypothetical protein